MNNDFLQLSNQVSHKSSRKKGNKGQTRNDTLEDVMKEEYTGIFSLYSSTLGYPKDKLLQVQVYKDKYHHKIYVNNDIESYLLFNLTDVDQHYVDKFLYIVHLLYEKYILNPVIKKTNGYINLNFKNLIAVLGKKTRKIIRRLVQLEIIETDWHYIKGLKSRGFRISKKFGYVNFKKRKTIIPIPKQEIKFANENERYIYDNMKSLIFNDQLSTKQIKELRSLSVEARQSITFLIEKIKNKDFFFSRDYKTGRIFHNISNLKREIRLNFTFSGGQHIIEIDVKNCQPLLLGKFVTDPVELQRFKEITESEDTDFYEWIQANLPVYGPGLTRDKIKEKVYQVIFGEIELTHTKPIYKLLAHHFPSLIRNIIKIKENNHNALAIELQRLEASIMIGKVVSEHKKARIPIITVHDSVLVPADCAEKSAKILAEAFKDHGFNIKLKQKDSNFNCNQL